MKKRGLAFLLSVSVAFSMTACSSQSSGTTAPQTPSESKTTAGTDAGTTAPPSGESGGAYTAGTYTASAGGQKGDVTVEVTFDENAITNIVVTDHSETFGIGWGLKTSPIEVLPEQMLAGQTVNVDMVTGATITSFAVKTAVKDCVTQAGGDAASMPEYHTEAGYEDTMEADVVVVGAGAAGLSAAVTAAEAGANVVLLEKQGVTGGSTARSGGKLLAAGTEWQTKQDFEDNADMMYEYLMSFSEGLIDENLLRRFCDDSAENLSWLENLGVKVQDVEPIHSALVPWRVHNTLGGGGQTDGHGGQISVPLTQKAEELGVTILYNVSGKELIQNSDGAVAGVLAEAADGTAITVNAKAVILATGGYAANKEMMARYSDFMPNPVTSEPAGNVGEGLIMAAAAGAKQFDSEGMQLVYVSFTCGVGINEESGLIVSAAGERVVNEWTYQSHVAMALAKAKSPVGYYIATANDPNPTVQYGMTLDSTVKAASVEELAEQLSMDPAVLKGTVDRYNELCAAGEDADFGKPAEYLLPLEGDTYYAIVMNPATSVTFGGLSINENSEVLNTSDQPIPGLYAAGEVAFTGLFGTEYPCCGMAIGSGVYFGRIAGVNAAALAK